MKASISLPGMIWEVRAIPKVRDSKKKTAVGTFTRSIAGRPASIWATRGIGATSPNRPSARSREKAIAGAFNLIFPLDLLIVADDVEFSDPVVLMAIGGVEYHGHTWEFGARRAKDILFTQRTMGAEEAHQIGLAREVVPRDQLWERTHELAAQIATNNAFGLAQAKRAVNQTLDTQGYYAALQSVFDVHSTGHGNAISVGGYPILMRLDEMKKNINR